MNTIDDYLADWISGLREQADSQQTPSKRHKVDSIDIQLERFLGALPKAMLSREWHINDLVKHLQSPWGASGHPHPRTVGAALRRIGWTQKRKWLNSVESIRVWLPPAQHTNKDD